MDNANSYNYYNNELKNYARNLRNDSTLAEVILWDKVLKKSQLRGYPFLRQRPIKHYIVDFFSKDLNLIFEIDGEIHRFHNIKDKKREYDLKELGYSIIRFDNEDILNAMSNVERTLNLFIDEFEKQHSTKKIRVRRKNTP